LTRPRVRGCNSALFSSYPDASEADLSAVSDTSQAHPRLSRADANSRRAPRDTGPPRKGARAIERLSEGALGLPRSARLKGREHYREALAAGPAHSRRYFRLYLRPNGLSEARLGIIASTRVAARAVDRNRFKRMAREAFRGARPRLGGLDLVIQLRRCPESRSTATARVEFTRVLEELAARTRGE